jgi:hypothetical protein
VLSLLVVPAVFTYMDDLEHFIRSVAGKVRGRPVEEVAVRAGDVGV